MKLMYHVNPPDIEIRVKYTITTRRTTARDMHILADAGYMPIRTRVQRSGLRNGYLGDTVRSEKGFARKQRLIRTKTPSGALARLDWYFSSPDELEALRTPFLTL